MLDANEEKEVQRIVSSAFRRLQILWRDTLLSGTECFAKVADEYDPPKMPQPRRYRVGDAIYYMGRHWKLAQGLTNAGMTLRLEKDTDVFSTYAMRLTSPETSNMSWTWTELGLPADAEVPF